VHVAVPGQRYPIALSGEHDVVFGGVGVGKHRRGAVSGGEKLGCLDTEQDRNRQS
jgi:hypothetical protein